MAINYQGLVTESLAKQISEQIRDAILEGRLKVDERLPTEEDLAARFEVSRPTIREALKRLAAQNLIRSRRGPSGGTFVARPSEEEARLALANAATLLVGTGEFTLSDVAEARRELERICARMAAERRTAEHLERMATEIARQRDPELSDEDFCASDVRFHRALVDAADNPVLGFVMTVVIEALQPASNMVIFRFRDRKEAARDHQRILDAIGERDVEAAEAAVDCQMVRLREQYRRAQAWRREKDDDGAAADLDGADDA